MTIEYLKEKYMSWLFRLYSFTKYIFRKKKNKLLDYGLWLLGPFDTCLQCNSTGQVERREISHFFATSYVHNVIARVCYHRIDTYSETPTTLKGLYKTSLFRLCWFYLSPRSVAHSPLQTPAVPLSLSTKQWNSVRFGTVCIFRCFCF